MLTSLKCFKRPEHCRDTMVLDIKVQYYKNVSSVPVNKFIIKCN